MDHIPTKKDTLDFMNILVPLLEKGNITDKDIEGIPKKLGIFGTQATIYFLTGVHELVSSIPIGRFSSTQTRDTLRQAVQKCLDNAIERELEEEAEEG